MSTNDSKYESIIKTLRAIGMQAFIQFYYDFKDASISDAELAEKIFRENPRARSNQQRFRIPRARYLFQNKLEIEALEIIIHSSRLPDEVRMKAESILNKEKVDHISREKESDEQIFLSELNNEIIYSLQNDYIKYHNNPEPSKMPHENTVVQYQRSRTVSKNALKMADYKCEINPDHQLFIRKNSNVNYTEPHHLVPLSAYRDFPSVNLDREQNVISLCSHCHNLLHYGKDIDDALSYLYRMRKDLLKSIGIELTYEQLKEYYS